MDYCYLLILQVLEKFVTGCLKVADSQGCKSIAFPAMGTGQLGYPRDLVAKHMYSCVDKFALQNPSSSVTEVFFVLYEKDSPTIQVICMDIQEFLKCFK